MSSRRSRSRQSGGSRITDDQIADLVNKLQDLLPEIRNRSRSSDKVEDQHFASFINVILFPGVIILFMFPLSIIIYKHAYNLHARN